MESWGVFFLGVIALASVVQAGFLIGLVVLGAASGGAWTRSRRGSIARSRRRSTTSTA